MTILYTFLSSPRFKPRDFSLKQIPNEPTTVRVNFTAYPQPTDCQWRLVAKNDEIQTNQSCKISLEGGIKGDYFVDLSATSEDHIILYITNELGTSKFQSNEAKMSASFSSVNLTILLSVVLPLLFLFSLVGCFIFRRRQRRNIFKNPNRTPKVSTSTTYSYSTMMSRDSRKTCNITTSNMGISADTTKRAHATEMENDKF